MTPRLSHANAAVVLSTIKVLMRFMEGIPDVEYKNGLLRKLAPPLVTLLSSEPEVQYVALRNINLIVQKRPEILKHEIKVRSSFSRNIRYSYDSRKGPHMVAVENRRFLFSRIFGQV